MIFAYTEIKKGLFRLDKTVEIRLSYPFGKYDIHEYGKWRIHNGFLYVYKGFLWDGVTGFFDRPDWLRASLVHDILLIAIYDKRAIPKSKTEEAHKLFKRIVEEDEEEEHKFFAKILYNGLKALYPIWRLWQ